MTNFLTWYFGLFRRVFARLGLCAMVGAIIGILAGFAIGLLQRHTPVFSPGEVVGIGLILGILLWVFVLFLLAFLLRYRFSEVAWATLVNSLLTCTLTATALNALQIPQLGFLVGTVIGIIVGALLCRFCDRKGRD